MNSQVKVNIFSNLQNIIFHSIFILLISIQVIISNQAINFFYILGLMVFIRVDFEYNWKLILLFSFYGFYQDSLLGYSFGFSALFFLFFFLIGQISNMIVGNTSNLINFYFFIFGLFIIIILERSYLFFKYDVNINFYYLFLNLIFTLVGYFIFKKLLNSSLINND